MINDQIYIEYGLERECIRAAAKKLNIDKDPDFNNLIQKLKKITNY